MKATYKVRIEKIRTETEDSKSYIFVPVDNDRGLFDYMPGQFFMLEAEIDRPETLTYDPATKQVRGSGKTIRTTEKKAYSIVSSPTDDGFIELLIKSENGVFAPYFLEQAKVGDVYKFYEPQGKFMRSFFEVKDNLIACWSSGSGIPSTMSIMRYKLDKGLDMKVAVFDSNKKLKDVIYHKRIKELIGESDDFSCVFTITREPEENLPKPDNPRTSYASGRFWLNEDNTLNTYVGPKWQSYFNTICGASTFISGKTRDKEGKLVKLGKGIEDHLLDVGLEKNRIDMDQFYLQ
jgi:ferredoxin-NADP reductase